MRKFLIALSFLMVLQVQHIYANPITAERAKALASAFMDNNTIQPVLVRKAERKRQKALAAKYQETAPYYIYSRGEGCGFVIVSGDDALPEVLGYTENGDYDENNMAPFLKWYLEYYGNLVEAAQEAGAGKMTQPSYATTRTEVSPLLTTHWHQSSPYNDLCPLRRDGGGRCVTGCVATAASQVIYYWRKDLPNTTQAATTSYTYGTDAKPTTAFPKGTPMKWELMLNSYGSEPSDYKEAVATLLAVVGGGAGLTYGSSTSGHNDNCRAVFKNIFNLKEGTENAKDWGSDYNNISDEQWATMLYKELSQARPVLYSGCNANGEGHAVVVDGYQESTGLFHFNLGWGGQSDGYYTTNRGKSPSWGFNDSWQECVTGVYPMQQNLQATIECPVHVYKSRNNTIKVKVSNQGTLDYSGVYLFASSSASKPTSLSDAKAKDTSTILSNDGSEYTFKFEVKPTTDNCYFTLTDNKLNVISQVKITTIVPETDVWLKKLEIQSSTEVENDYPVVYNNKATASATFENKANVGYEGTLKLNLYGSSDGGDSFRYIATKSSKLSVDAMGEGSVQFSIVSTTTCPLYTDTLYYATLQLESTAHDIINVPEDADTLVKFVMKESDMKVLDFTDGCLALSGHWDNNAFTTFAKKTIYKTATSYDLTKVTCITDITSSPVNPNAVIYVDDENAEGYNVVYGNHCKNLTLTPGYNFVPKEDFSADYVCMNINQTANKWGLITTPCDLTVPYGMIARTIDSHAASGITNKTTDVTELSAGKTYLISSSSSRNQILCGFNSKVSTNTLQNPDSAIVGTYINAEIPAGSMVLDMEDTQYFRKTEEGGVVDALRGYFYDPSQSREFKANSSLVSDPAFFTLGEAIEEAYDIRDEYADVAYQSAYHQLTDSIAKAEQVYSEREYTNAQIKALANNLLQTAAYYATQYDYVEGQEIDCTTKIVNPSFEDGKTTGWTVADTKVTTIRKADATNYKGVGADGTYLLYSYSSNSSSGSEIHQVVTGLDAGYYRLSAMVGSDSDNTITVFAGDSTVTVPAHSFGKYYLTKAEINDILVSDGTLDIGIKAGDWYKVDDFRLVYTSLPPVGIDEISSNAGSAITNDGIYDLSGRQIKSVPNQGIYIVNGKKIFVR